MAHQHVVDLPTFGAGPATIGDLIADQLEAARTSETLTARFVNPPLFEVRGMGDSDLIAQLLVRAAIDNGFRTLRLVLLEPVLHFSVDLVEHLEHKLPSVVSLEITITKDTDPPTVVLGPNATSDDYREHLKDSVAPPGEA